MPSVYLETSVISYLASKPSRDLVLAAHQQITHDWWDNSRAKFDVFISQVVMDEIRSGDLEAAKKRLKLVEGIPALSLTPEVLNLAKAFTVKGAIPKKAATDALHIAIASIYDIDYLLTWNCNHIANLFIQKNLEKILLGFGLRLPKIGTPEALMGG